MVAISSSNKSKYWVGASLVAVLSACGGSGGSDFIGGGASSKTGTVSIGISDSPVEDVKQVWIEVDKITLKKPGKDDIVIDNFTISALNLDNAETFQIDLLEYQQDKQIIVDTDREIPAGSYSDIILDILDNNNQQSYVIENDDERREIKVPSNTLKLGSFTVTADETQTFTIEFNLRKSMTYTGSNNTYILKPRGVRVQSNTGDRKISGSVDSSLFDAEEPCRDNPATEGNVVYLYEGHNLNQNNLVDVIDPDNLGGTTPPANAIEPFAAEAVYDTTGTDQWGYMFAFIPAGDYTLVFSCNAGDDDPEKYDGITLPLPTDQIIELSTGSSSVICDLPIENDSCD